MAKSAPTKMTRRESNGFKTPTDLSQKGVAEICALAAAPSGRRLHPLREDEEFSLAHDRCISVTTICSWTSTPTRFSR